MVNTLVSMMSVTLYEIFDFGVLPVIISAAAGISVSVLFIRAISRRLRFSKAAALAAMFSTAVLLTAFGSFGIYCGNVLLIKNAGVKLVPGYAFEPRKMEVFLQNDPGWREESMGDSGYKLGGHGCLVSVIASVVQEKGYIKDVRDLNTLFSEKGVYNREGEVIWYKISEALPGVQYHYQRFFNSRTLMRDLEEGRSPLVMVRYHGTGVYHWVLVAGSDDGDFLVIDPLQQDKKYIRLQTHGRVYAYRVLYGNNPPGS